MSMLNCRMRIGSYSDDSESATLNPSSLLRHVSILGTTGSGKTVMGKIILEECTLKGIPSIVLDVKGDLARLALPVEKDPKADSKRQSEWSKKAEVRIWTPKDESGLPISINPFKIPPQDLDEEKESDAWERMASGLAVILGYDVSKHPGLGVKRFLERILIRLAIKNSVPSNFGQLGRAIREQDPEEYDDLIKPSTIKELERRANSLDGSGQDMFTSGTPLSIPMMLEPRLDGRTPVNVIYLSTLVDEGEKMTFIQQFCRELYDWMLTNPSQSPQVMVFLDEAAEFIPAGASKPPSKPIIERHLKQARAFGVSWMLATQSPNDIDYKIQGQAATLFLGQFTSRQDKESVRQILKSMDADQDVLNEISTFKPGEFLKISSAQEGGEVKKFNARWLLAPHGNPMTREELPALVNKATRDWARSYIETRPKKIKISNKVRKTAKSPSKKGSQTTSGSPILGGFTHLADDSDPMHVMMGITNAVTAATLLLCTYTLGNLWADGEISQLPFVISAAVSALMGFGLILEFILRNESELSMRIRSKARLLEGLVLAWIWILWWMELSGTLEISKWAFMILISQTLLTAFFALEIFHRVRLGRPEMEGETIADKLKSGVKGIPEILTGAEIEELRATSEQIHDTFRTFMEVATVAMLAALMATNLSLDSAWVNDLALRIVSLDVALLLSKGFVSMKR